MAKVGMENLAIHIYGAKVIRLSRTIHQNDSDLSAYFHELLYGYSTEIPSFFYRNYLTRSQAVDGIEYFVRNWDKMPNLVNYGSERPIPLYTLVRELIEKIGFDSSLLKKRTKYMKNMTPRPTKAGFSISLARKLGFPIYTLNHVVDNFWGEHAT